MNFLKYAKRYAMSEDNFNVFYKLLSMFFSFVKSIVLLGFGIGLYNWAFIIIGVTALLVIVVIGPIVIAEDKCWPFVFFLLFCLLINPLIFIAVICSTFHNKDFREDSRLKVEYENSYDKIKGYDLED